MNIDVRVQPGEAPLPPVEYRWDADTDILTASVAGKGRGDGMSGSVEIQGADGSWLVLDVSAGHIAGVEVAVWPEVKKHPQLPAPDNAQAARVIVPSRPSQPGVASLEVETKLSAEADNAERTIHFRFGARPASTVRIAQDLLLEIDERQRLVGAWLLNVPPFPGEADETASQPD